jgi:uncharacterized membrane protein HdeD (DUF308 family)
MTDPQNGPGGQPAGSGHIRTGASSVGTGNTGAGAPGTDGPASSASGGNTETGNVVTGTRTTTTQKNVPQQLGKQAESGRGQGRGYDEQIATPGLGAGGEMMSKAAKFSWAAVLLGGLCMIAAGIALLVWPHVTLTIVALIIGAALVVSGVVRLYEGFTARDRSGGMRAAYMVIGILAVIVGLYCLKNHAVSILLLAFVTGVYFIMHGIADIGVAATADVPGRGLRGVLGVFSIAAGIIMVVWPGLTLVLLFTIVGAWLIFYGLVLAGLAFGLRKAAKAVSSEGMSMSAGNERLATSGAR